MIAAKNVALDKPNVTIEQSQLIVASAANVPT